MGLKIVPQAADDEALEAVSPRRARDVQTRWGGEPSILVKGFVGVPIVFLEKLATLKPFPLNPAETLFIICIMAHKWDERPPFPSYKRIAQWMGKTESYARRLAADLETKGYLKRLPRVGRTNQFDLSGLFLKLTETVSSTSAPSKSASPRKRRVRRKGRAA